jgi:hypothetical protein
MSYAPPHPGAGGLKKPFFWSLIFHTLLFGSLTGLHDFFASAARHVGQRRRRRLVSVGLVAKLPGITCLAPTP